MVLRLRFCSSVVARLFCCVLFLRLRFYGLCVGVFVLLFCDRAFDSDAVLLLPLRCCLLVVVFDCVFVDYGGILANGQAYDGLPNDDGDITYTRLDLEYDTNNDGRGEYAFNESEYGKHNPYGYKEKGSGDDRSFKDELEEIIYNFGLEYSYSNNFILRAGFIYDLEGDIKSPTVGAGVKFNNYGFDFGYTAGENDHPRANTMFFSLSIGLGA